MKFNKRMDTYGELCRRLSALYDAGEAQAVVRLLLERRFGMSFADVLSGKLSQLASGERADLERQMGRLASGEPVQYVLGESEFCSRWFRVTPDVLIPRPETAELCRWVLDATTDALKVLDVGTGSGCIAITLQKERPGSVAEGWDVSEAALRVARQNGAALGASATFLRQDVLLLDADGPQSFSFLPADGGQAVIVSNPPYICQCERASMAVNVIGHEPHQALFVPDDDPLLFYRAIARLARRVLPPGGQLFFEINPLCAELLLHMLREEGFGQTETRSDQFGKLRFTRSRL